MARTKQTARKSSGGAAPRQQLATQSSVQFRHFLTSQQSAGNLSSSSSSSSPSSAKALFINCENTFRDFVFERKGGQPEVEFDPRFSAGRVAALTGAESEEGASMSDLYLRLDMTSCLDGDGIAREHGRQALDLCFVLDISGSMNCTFPNDSDRRRKLEVAVSCLKSILPQLSCKDRIAIITFNTEQQVICNLNYATKKNQKDILGKLNRISSHGGTALANGLTMGFQTLHSARAPREVSGGGASRSKRVVFLTDMQSSPSDEAQVILLGRNAAAGCWGNVAHPSMNVVTSDSMFLSIIGIGVDLSVSTLRQVTAIPGARYISAATAQEFTSIVSEEFLYDVTPIAFNIRVILPESVRFRAVYGASELSDTPPGASSVTISSEFANPLREDGSTTGGVLLMQLQENIQQVGEREESMRRPTRRSTLSKRLHSQTDILCAESRNISSNTANPSDNSIRVVWVDRQGTEQSIDVGVPLDIPPLEGGATASENCDIGLRKAVALRQYVACLEDYALKAPVNDDDGNPPAAVMKALQSHQTRGLLAMASLDGLPGPIPPTVLRAHKYATLFTRLRSYLIAEMGVCGDSTLMGENKNILQTVTQVVDLETLELTSRLQEIRSQESAAAYDALSSSASATCHGSFLCPITMELMINPCIAEDGHSYERKAIEQWFRTKRTSPVTNLPMASTALIENHSLRCAIDQYVLSNAAAVELQSNSTPEGALASSSSFSSTSSKSSSSPRSSRRIRQSTPSGGKKV